MRVLITTSLYPTPAAPKIVGGAEIVVRRLAESLAARGDTVEVIRAASEPGQEMETCNGVDVYSAPVRNIYLPFTRQRSAPTRGIWHAIEDWQWTARLVSERIRHFRPDVLHSNNLSGLTTAVWRASCEHRVPIAHTLHDYYLTCPRCSRFANGHACEHTCASCKLLTINRKRVTSRLTAVVGVSRRILDIHTRLGLFADTPLRTVIRHASATFLEPQPRIPTNNEVVFGFIGRLTVEKGIDNLVRALATVPADRVRLLIAGRAGDSERARLRALAPSARITFLGFIPAEEFYRRVDVVVVPSIWEEPGPLITAEARAAGKPILGTRFGGIPEAIVHGETGWLSAEDPMSLAACIEEIAANPGQILEIGRKLQNDSAHWTFTDVVSAYRQLFQRLRGMNGGADPEARVLRDR